MKVFISILIGLAVVAGAIVIFKPGSQNVRSETSGGTLSALNGFYDFGTISMADGKVKTDYMVSNIGSNPNTIKKVFTSCMCTSVTLKINENYFGPFGMPGHGVLNPIQQTLEPGQKITVSATFDPAAHGPAGVGTVSRNIVIETEESEPLILNFRAAVTP